MTTESIKRRPRDPFSAIEIEQESGDYLKRELLERRRGEQGKQLIVLLAEVLPVLNQFIDKRGRPKVMGIDAGGAFENKSTIVYEVFLTPLDPEEEPRTVLLIDDVNYRRGKLKSPRGFAEADLKRYLGGEDELRPMVIWRSGNPKKFDAICLAVATLIEYRPE